MKEIERLLKKAKQYLSEVIERSIGTLSDNLDGFIEALGLNPDKYKKELPNGKVGYDDIAALNDCAKEIWEDNEGDG